MIVKLLYKTFFHKSHFNDVDKKLRFNIVVNFEDLITFARFDCLEIPDTNIPATYS